MLIPCNYWAGNETIKYEYPWITPEAIHTLELWLKPHHEVLEFGSGGSTLFFARRAKRVYTIDTDSGWQDKVREKGLNNIEYYHATPPYDLSVITWQYDCALIDCVEIDRRTALAKALEHIRKPGLVVIDNYAAHYCEGISKILEPYTNQVPLDDPHWAGKGTLIVYC